ncbi:MAG: NAD(P)-binding protein [Candidatus Cybelea sp.]
MPRASISRSAFLAGAGSVLTACSAPQAALPQRPAGFVTARGLSPNIVIVGAGVAGLTCAYRLRQAGIQARLRGERSYRG